MTSEINSMNAEEDIDSPMAAKRKCKKFQQP